MFNFFADKKNEFLNKYDANGQTKFLLPAQKETLFDLFSSFIDSVFEYAIKRNNIALAYDVINSLHKVTQKDSSVDMKKFVELEACFKDKSFVDHNKSEILKLRELGFELAKDLFRWRAICDGKPLPIHQLNLHNLHGRKIDRSVINQNLNAGEKTEIPHLLGFVLDHISQHQVELTPQITQYLDALSEPKKSHLLPAAAVETTAMLVKALKQHNHPPKGVLGLSLGNIFNRIKEKVLSGTHHAENTHDKAAPKSVRPS